MTASSFYTQNVVYEVPDNNGTSSSTLNIGTGSQTLTVAPLNLDWVPGTSVTIANQANPLQLMSGVITAYNPTTGVTTVNVTATAGSGSFSAWNVALSGVAGANGAAGPAGPTGPTGPQGPAGPISGPGTTVVGDFAMWNSTTGAVLQDYTPTQATAALNVFTSALKGLVPASGGGTTNFLRADGTWAAAGGNPGGSNTQVQFNNSGVFGGDGGFTYAGNGQATLALGTITANAKALNITGTWNAAGVTFDAPLFMNITNTASATGSLLADLQVGGSSLFTVNTTGAISIGGGAAPAGSLIAIGNGSRFIGSGSGTSLYSGVSWGVNGNLFIANSLQWNSAGWNNTDSAFNVNLYCDAAAATVALSNGSTNPGAFRVYNTTDQVGSNVAPINFERGVFDWTSNLNYLTIGTGAGGTGSTRAALFVTGTNLAAGIDTNGSMAFGAGSNISLASGIFLGQLIFNNNNVTGNQSLKFGWISGSTVGSNQPNQDTSLYRVAAGVVGIGGATPTQFFQWGGQARVTSDFSVTSSAALTNVTGLSVNLQAGRTYWFETELYVTDAAAGGVQAAIAGTCTATAIQYTGYTIADNAIKGKTNATALATAVGSTTTTETAGIIVRITGIITVNAAGTLTVQMAQNTSNATATTAKRGSYLIVHDMP